MNLAPSSRITPWVLRLIIANAVVLLLMRTLFTSPALAGSLAFSPQDALREPWTFFTYMFVHAGLLHLLGNMLMLFVFGSAVESRMGSRTFILYYLLCGVGAAVFSLGLSGIMQVSAFVGASGAVLGLALAFAISSGLPPQAGSGVASNAIGSVVWVGTLGPLHRSDDGAPSRP